MARKKSAMEAYLLRYRAGFLIHADPYLKKIYDVEHTPAVTSTAYAFIIKLKLEELGMGDKNSWLNIHP